MEEAKQSHPAFIYYAGGLFIWAGAFVAGNIVGRIIASLQGWDDFSYDRPGAVLYAGLQAGIGAYLGVVASKRWLQHGKYVKFWLACFVWLGSGVLFVGIGLAIYLGRVDVIGWSALSSAVGLAVTEVIRRLSDGDFD